MTNHDIDVALISTSGAINIPEHAHPLENRQLSEGNEKWVNTRLRNVVNINPKTLLPITEQEVDFFPMNSIEINGGVIFGEKKGTAQSSAYSVCKEQDVIFAKVTPCFENGKSAIIPTLTSSMALATTEVIVLRPNSRITPEFLHYRIKASDFIAMGESEMKGAGGLKRVPERQVANFVFDLPSLLEQQSITAFLDRETSIIDQKIALNLRKQRLLAELRKATIHEAVTRGIHDHPFKASGVKRIDDIPCHWDIARVKDLLVKTKIETLSPLRYVGLEHVEGGRGWVKTRLRNVVDINPKTLLPITEREVDFFPMNSIEINGGVIFGEKKGTAQSSAYSVCKEQDVIFAKVTPCFENGKSAIIPTLTSSMALATTEVIVLRSNSRITPEFLHYRIKASDFIAMGESEMKGAGGLKRVPERQVANFIFDLPSLLEQQSITAFLDRETSIIDQKLVLLARQKELLQEQRKALIHEVVTGKVRVI